MMTKSDNIVAFKVKDRRIALDAKARRTVSECRGVAQRALPKLMSSLFEELDDALYELADKSDTNQLQTSYFDAMRVVRRQRERIQHDFTRGVLEDYDALWTQGPDRIRREVQPSGLGAGDRSDLSLMDNTELEQTLAVSNMVSKGENRYQRELFLLNQRFATLLGTDDIESGYNPLGPNSVCNHFYRAMTGLSVDTPVLLVIYKLFDKQVMSYIGGLYDEVNSLLARAGITPRRTAPKTGKVEIRPSSESRQQPIPSGSYPGRAHEDHAYGGDQGYAAPGSHDVELFDTMRELLVDYRSRAGMAMPMSPENLPQVAMSELVAALSQLQRGGQGQPRRGDDGVSNTQDLRNRLNSALELEHEGERSRELGRQDDDAIDVISMLFEFILEDPNLPDTMKALIARLQIPMLKVAIMDKAFFSHKLHPARRLLNSLARAAVGWSDDGDRSENSLYGRIEAVVDRLLSGFEDDASVFEELHAEFTAYTERERRGAEIAEERTNQVSRGKEQLSVAKKLVGIEITNRLSQCSRLPLVARTLLEEGWKDVLLLTYLRQGANSPEWERHLKTADNLLWSVEPKREYDQRQKLLRVIPDLLQSLREALNGISYDQHKMARMFKELQACHIACLRGTEGPQTMDMERAQQQGSHAKKEATPVSSPVVEDTQLSAPLTTGPNVIRNDEFSELAENLMVGDWLELEEEHEHRVRIKLSWKSDVSDAYVFVNRRGVKVLELTMVGVARLFREGKAKILQQVEAPIMDRALNAMMETLKSA